jgi:calpain-15
MFDDKEFPPNETSLGNVKGVDVKDIVWKRATDIEYRAPIHGKKQYMNKLFEKGLEPDDVCQGALGDCWLLSAIASLTNHPESIDNVFVTRQWNPRGKYTFKFWDATKYKGKGGWHLVTIDDYIPVKKSDGKPVFEHPRGNEMWVMLLEKAFAKYMGSFAAIEGNMAIYAMHVITGDEVRMFVHEAEKQCFAEEFMKVEGGTGKDAKVSMYYADANKKIPEDAMYDLLCKYHKEGLVLSGGTLGKDQTLTEGRQENNSGLVAGHAYTILQVYQPRLTLKDDIKLIKIRNPWGTFEWKGDWGDHSPLWDQHPLVRTEMGKWAKEDGSDGCFYMNWKDFLYHFRQISVCYTKRDLSRVRLDVIEEFDVCGPTAGCVYGCTKFWCCCSGCYHLWCPRSSADALAKAKKQQKKAVKSSAQVAPMQVVR